MAQSPTAFTSAIRIVHDADGFHYLKQQENKESASALYVCPKCGDALVVTHFEPTKAEDTGQTGSQEQSATNSEPTPDPTSTSSAEPVKEKRRRGRQSAV